MRRIAPLSSKDGADLKRLSLKPHTQASRESQAQPAVAAWTRTRHSLLQLPARTGPSTPSPSTGQFRMPMLPRSRFGGDFPESSFKSSRRSFPESNEGLEESIQWSGAETARSSRQPFVESTGEVGVSLQRSVAEAARSRRPVIESNESLHRPSAEAARGVTKNSSRWHFRVGWGLVCHEYGQSET